MSQRNQKSLDELNDVLYAEKDKLETEWALLGKEKKKFRTKFLKYEGELEDFTLKDKEIAKLKLDLKESDKKIKTLQEFIRKNISS